MGMGVEGDYDGRELGREYDEEEGVTGTGENWYLLFWLLMYMARSRYDF